MTGMLGVAQISKLLIAVIFTSFSRMGVEPRVRIHKKFSVRMPITSDASELMKYSISIE